MTDFLRVPVNFQSPYDVTSLPAHWASATITPCVCLYAVSPIDGEVKAATSWSRNLMNVPGYDGVTFKSTSGAAASNIETQQGQAPTNMEMNVYLLAAGIPEADLLAGKWVHAPVTIFVMNYEAPKMGQYVTHKGYFGQTVQKGNLLTVEVLGFNQVLGQTRGRITTAECDHTFGDAGCTLDLAGMGFIKTGAITAVTDQAVFRVASLIGTGVDYFGNGELQFTSGNNNGYKFKIDSWDDATGEFSLRTPTPYLPVNGNTISAKRGCRKRASDCTGFSNILNFNGFPWIPTIEDLSRLPLS